MVVPPPIQLANLGMADSIILMVLALVVFGPRRLPQIGRQIGKLMFEFRKASNDFKFQMEEELRAAEDADRRRREEAERQRVATLAAASQVSVSAPAQTVEAQADIGAAESPSPSPAVAESTYPEQYPAETSPVAAEATDTAPVIQPPQTGEQVSASRPDYFFEPSTPTVVEPEAVAQLNPEASAEANAASAVTGAAPTGAKHGANGAIPSNSVPTPEPPPPPKEPVSQNG
jgi:sec-independent protein translocase protein TatB